MLKEHDEKLAKMKCELLEIECKALKQHLEQKEEQERIILEQLDGIARKQSKEEQERRQSMLEQLKWSTITRLSVEVDSKKDDPNQQQ